MVDTRQIGGAPTALLRALAGGPLSRAEVKEQLGFDWRQTTNSARALMRRGYLTVLENGRYQLSDSGLEAAGRGEKVSGSRHVTVKTVRDTFRERAWRAMRVRKVFTIGEIVSDAASDDGGQPRDNAARYISRLKQAGYIKEMPRRAPGTAIGSNGFKRFALVRNSGPKAPVFREGAGCIHDPNTGEDISCALR